MDNKKLETTDAKDLVTENKDVDIIRSVECDIFDKTTKLDDSYRDHINLLNRNFAGKTAVFKTTEGQIKCFVRSPIGLEVSVKFKEYEDESYIPTKYIKGIK